MLPNPSETKAPNFFLTTNNDEEQKTRGLFNLSLIEQSTIKQPTPEEELNTACSECSSDDCSFELDPASPISWADIMASIEDENDSKQTTFTKEQRDYLRNNTLVKNALTSSSNK